MKRKYVITWRLQRTRDRQLAIMLCWAAPCTRRGLRAELALIRVTWIKGTGACCVLQGH